MQSMRVIAAASALAVVATAQFSVVLPAGYDTGVENSANVFPFGNAITGYPGLRILHVYDSSHFTSQLINFPILITGLRWRAANTAGSWTGGTYNTATVSLSTAAVDYTAASTTWAANHGPDLTTILNGAVVVQPGTGNGLGVPGPYHVDVQFPTTPFLYDPNLGDLCVDCDVPTGSWGGGGLTALASVTAAGVPAPLASRVYSSTLYPNANAVDTNILVMQIDYIPASGLYAGFTSDVTTGASPLTVNFSDASYSSDPLGVIAWAWDLDGDSIIDSTLQNPTFVYPTCGTYSVTQTVFDASHPSSTITRTGYIVTDAVSASFTFTTLAPGVIQFTDTSTPTPTSWAWDFDGDSVIDDTTQNPAHFYAAACTGANVTLTASRLCGPPDTASQAIVITPNSFQLTNAGGNGTTSATWVGNVFDGQITNPDGVKICGISVRPYSFSGPYNVAFYASSGSYLDTVGATPRYATPSAWRLLATGTGNSTNPPFTGALPLEFIPLSNDVYLPQGDYSFAVFLQNPAGTVGIAYTNGPLGPVSDANMNMFVGGHGRSVTTLFGTGGFTPRMWNGEFHYSTWSDDGAAGIGFAGTGCANSLGQVSALTPSADPTLGSVLNIAVNNLPLSNAIMVTGYGNTTSLFGPLPLDLTSLGAPGCFLRVSTEAPLFLAGAGNQVNWIFNIPNDPAFSGQQFYNQAIVIDFAANAVGAVMSDATGMLIGN